MSSTDYANQSPVEQLFAAFGSSELPLSKHSQALQASLVIYTGACYVTAITINNTNAAAQFVQLFDATALPADGVVPTMLLTVAASSDKFVTYPLPGRFFRTGVVVCNSSTAATKTIGAGDCFFDVQYIPVT